MTEPSFNNQDEPTKENNSSVTSRSATIESPRQTETQDAAQQGLEQPSSPVQGADAAPTDMKERTPWSRRRFLRGMVVSLGTLTAACGVQQPTPTPTPTATSQPIQTGTPEYTAYLPQINTQRPSADGPVGDGPVATAEPRLEPTAPKATPTNTAIPPTPTPVATPFPPGPPSKLGIHVERNDPQLFALLKTEGIAVVKTLELDANFAGQIKTTSPRTKLIGRIHTDQVELGSLDPIGAARTFVSQILIYAEDPARKGWFDGWEAYNEPVPGNAEEMKRLAEFEAERTRLLAERGIRSIIGNFGTGQPPLELWEHFLPAMQAAKEHDGWLGLHEYAAPTIYYLSTRENQGRYPGVAPEDSGWLTLRYRNVYNQILRPAGLDIPLVMTELGVDGLVKAGRNGPQSARGWQHFQEYWAQNGYGLWGPGAYVEQLVWYDRAMQQDDYVIGGCIYGLGTSNEWLSYDIGTSPVIGVLEQYLGVHA